MKYILILSLLVLTACSSQPNRCNQDNAGKQKSRLVE
jgi:starvation-inducible outer membrane lipoprotein